MPISRMQNPRQLYGLGSIVKSIGKGVKSIIKSPIGKAAILGFGANALMGGGGLGSILGRMGMTQPASGFGGGSGIMGMFGKAKNFVKGLSGMQQFAGGSAIAALMSTGMGEAEAQATSRNPEAVKQYLAKYHSNLNKNATQDEVNKFVATNTSEYAMGGRVKYASGSERMILPRAKPRESDGKKVLDLLAKDKKASQNTLGSKTLFNLVGQNAAKAYKAGDISKSEYDSMMKPFFGEPGERLSRKISEERKELKANGGRIGLEAGVNEDFQNYLKGKKKFQREQNSANEYREYLEDKRRQEVANQKQMVANGGRIGLKNGTLGGNTDYNAMVTEMYIKAGGQKGTGMDIKSFANEYFKKFNKGGRVGYAYGGNEIVDQASGIMGLPQRTNEAGIKELDLRDSGGFIPPVGVKEKADDVPAMLSNNEFVMTADAVRGMGDGDVNEGAQRLYDQMKMLEKGGRV